MAWNTKIGDKFNRLTIINQFRIKKPNGMRKMCECRCDCGNISVVEEHCLISGNTKSCGCWMMEVLKQKPVTHGLTYHKLYYTWCRVKGRCYNPNSPDYPQYGAIGIKIHEEWLHDPKKFIDYCMTINGWDNPKFSIDRINPYGNYEPNNVRFTNAHIQAANKRKRSASHFYTGVSMQGNKYQCSIMVNYKSQYLGLFSTAEEAAKARDNYIIDNNLWEYPLQIIEQ